MDCQRRTAAQYAPSMADAPKPVAAKLDVAQTHVASEWKIGSPLISCRYDPKGRFLFAGAQDYQVWRCEAATGKATQLKGANAWVRGIAFSPDGASVYTGGYDGRLLWWPLEGGAPSRAIEAHQGWINAIAVSPDGSLIATCGNDLLVRVWSASDGQPRQTLRGHETRVYNAAFHPDGKHLVSVDLKCNVLHWTLADGKVARPLKVEALHIYDKGFMADIGGARSLQFDTKGAQLAVGGITNVSNAFAGIGNPCVVMLDWATGKSTTQHLAKETFNGVAWGLALHPEGLVLAGAGGGSGGQVYFWKPGEKNEFHKLKLKDTCRDMHLAPDGLHLATAHFDGFLRICRMSAKPA